MNWTDYFSDKIKTVPDELQEAILAVDFLAGIRLVQKKYLLHIDQGQELEGATFQFMFGDLPTPDSFKKTVQEKLRITEGLANSILEDIEKNVLAPIRTKLQEVEEKQLEDEVYDELIFGKVPEGEEPLDTKEEEIKQKNTATLKTDIEEDHSTLSSDDILNEIENPTPAIKRQVVIESNVARPASRPNPTTSTTPITPTNTQSNMGVTTFSDIASGFNKKPEPEISRPKESVQKTASVLQSAMNPEQATSQKINEVTTSKPKEVVISSDPYREQF